MCEAPDPADCWCEYCRGRTRWTGSEVRFLYKGPKIFVRSEGHGSSSVGDRFLLGGRPVQPWRVRAFEVATALHGALNRTLGVAYLNYGDAICAAWNARDARGQRILDGAEILLHERAQRRANKARHQGIGGPGLRPDPRYGRWGDRASR